MNLAFKYLHFLVKFSIGWLVVYVIVCVGGGTLNFGSFYKTEMVRAKNPTRPHGTEMILYCSITVYIYIYIHTHIRLFFKIFLSDFVFRYSIAFLSLCDHNFVSIR